MIATGFVIYYIVENKPMEDPARNMQESFNETIVLVAAYPLVVFTNFVSDEGMQLNVAWFLVGLICLNIIVNIGALIVAVCKQI